ncbi:MAG: DUF4352 domain-containing protein [Rubrobacteraceae bacterium]
MLIVVIAIIAAVSGGGGEGEQAGSNEGNDSGSGDVEQQPTAATGESLDVGETTWKVSGATKQQQLTSSFDENKEGNFVVVDFQFTNNGSESVTLDSGMLTLIDGRDREFDVDTDSLGFVPPDKDIFLDQVNPGVTKDGQVIFTVAPDAQDFTLETSEGMFGTNTGKIDLGSLQ